MTDTKATSRTLARTIVLIALAVSTALPAAPPDRATAYDGSSRCEFPDHAAFRPSSEVTIEAWVRRVNTSRCETIASKNFRDSWWLGFCPRLRVYTSGGNFVDATRALPGNQWCHVAVTVDIQGFTQLFIDGQPAGTGALPPVAHNTGPMTVGADVDGSFPFLGSIDELRIWNVARDPKEIDRDRFREIIAAPKLVAAIADGGANERVHALTGTPIGNLATSPDGVLPHDLFVPESVFPLMLDGKLDANEYGSSDQIVLRAHTPNTLRDATARVTADDESIWVGIEGLVPDGGEVTLLYDPEPEVSDTAHAIVVSQGGSRTRVFTRDGPNWTPCKVDEGPCPAVGLLDGAFESDPASMEFRLSRSLLANGPVFRLGILSTSIDNISGETRRAPGNADEFSSETWALAKFAEKDEPATGSGSCEDPWRIPSFPHVLDLSNAEPLIDDIECIPLPLPDVDSFVRFNPSETGRFRIVARPLDDSNIALAIGLDCLRSEDDCLAGSDQNGSGDAEVLHVDLIAGEQYSILISDSFLDDDPSLGEVEVRIDPIDNVDDENLFATRVDLGGPDDLELVTESLRELWSYDAERQCAFGLIHRGDVAGLAVQGIGVDLHEPPPSFEEPERRVALRFDRFRYDLETEAVRVELTHPSTPSYPERRIVVATGAGDAEFLDVKDTDDWSGSIPIRVTNEKAVRGDGTLHVRPDEILIGLSQDPDGGGNAESTATAIAVMAGRAPLGHVSVDIDESVEPSIPETEGRIPGESERPLGAIEDEHGVRLMLGIEELVIDTRDDQTEEILEASGGRVIDHGNAAGNQNNPFRLVRFDPEIVDPARAAVALELLGAKGTVRVSDERTLGLLTFFAESRLRNLNVSANWVLDLHAQPRSEEHPRDDGQWDVFQDPSARPGLNAIQGFQRAWMYTSIFDRDIPGTRVAVIDSNFCPGLEPDCNVVGGYDFFNFSDTRFGQAFTAGAGARYHGTMMASAIGGRFSNGVGIAGVGGQVSDLLLYNVGFPLYYFDAATATFAAVANGAKVINMSFGFPCTFAGLNWCDPILGGITCAILGPIIDLAGIALSGAQAFLPFPLPPLPPGALCPFLIGFLSGSNAAITTAITTALAANVNVVASAGNRLGDTPAAPVELFWIVPAMIPGVITVGATDRDFQNREYFGARVDVWLEETGPAFTPFGEDCDAWSLGVPGQSSTAAAMTSGLVALMRTVNPRLPAIAVAPILHSSSLRAPGGDGLVLRFLQTHEALIQAARLDGLPDPREFAPSFGFDEADPAIPTAWQAGLGSWVRATPHPSADTRETAIQIPIAEALAGTFLHDDAAIHSFTPPGRSNDQDWFELGADVNECDHFEVTVELEYPTAGGELTLSLPELPTRSTVDGLTRKRWVIPNAVLSCGLLFQVEGDDNFYRLRVSATSLSRFASDAYEANETHEDAALIGPGEFVEVDTTSNLQYRALIEDLTIHCAGDEDWYRIRLPNLPERCVPVRLPCGGSIPGWDLANVLVSASGFPVELKNLDGSDLETEAPQRIRCPVTNGHREFLVRVARPCSVGRYQLRVNYTVPRGNSTAEWFERVASPIFCCFYGGATCDRLPEDFDPRAVGIDGLDLTIPDLGIAIFDAYCPSDPCGRTPRNLHFFDVDRDGVSLDLQFHFHRAPGPNFEGMLLDSELQPFGQMVPISADGSTWRLTSGELPLGPYMIAIAGLDFGTTYEIYNESPVEPLPERNRLTPRVEEDACGDLVVTIDVQCLEPVRGFQCEISWDPEVAELVEARTVGAFAHFDYLGRQVSPGMITSGVVDFNNSIIDVTEPTPAVEIRLRPVGTGGSTQICVGNRVGDPPDVIEPVLTVDRAGDPFTLTPRTDCSAASFTPDVVAPEIFCPDEVQREPSANGEIVTWKIEAVDECSDVTVECTPPSGSTFPFGTTTVVCVAQDASGNQSACSFDIVVDAASFRRGDANDSGKTDLADAVFILGFLFTGGPAPVCPDAADSDDDGRLNISDAIKILSFLFTGSPPPPAPGPLECGNDPTEDRLGDCESEACADA